MSKKDIKLPVEISSDDASVCKLLQEAKALREDIAEETATCQKVIDELNSMNEMFNENVHNVDSLLQEAKCQIETIKEECDAIVKANPMFPNHNK